MGRFREIKRQMRSDVHREAGVAALYIPVPNATPVPVTVRVHRRLDGPTIGDAGSLSGFSNEAMMAITEDRLRFKRSDLPSHLRVNAVVSVEAGEAYNVEFWYPRDDEFITARVTPLTEEQTAGLPFPNPVSGAPPITDPQNNETNDGLSVDGGRLRVDIEELPSA